MNSRAHVGSARDLFRILVIGDSILWGQGLRPHEKIHAHVAAELRRHRPAYSVRTKMLAHSGAILGMPDDDTPPPVIEGEHAGEVPRQHPTVFQQVRAALGRRERSTEIDLIIAGGGVNDVHIATLINPLDGSLDDKIDDAFYRRTKILLELLCSRFPNAVIVLTGNYPFFSDSSERELARAALETLGLDVKGLPGLIGDLLLDIIGSDAIEARSRRFRDRSHEAMRRAVQELIEVMPVLSSRLCFADPCFEDDHAIAAPQSLLFAIGADLSAQDALAEARARACAANAERIGLLERLACPKASVGHPNPAGARRYADAILLQLRHLMPRLFVAGD